MLGYFFEDGGALEKYWGKVVIKDHAASSGVGGAFLNHHQIEVNECDRRKAGCPSA